jgi:hypothetical protein
MPGSYSETAGCASGSEYIEGDRASKVNRRQMCLPSLKFCGWSSAAKEHAKTFLIGATAKNNRGEVLQAHELSGAIALQERK